MIIHSGGSEIEALNLHTGEKLWGYEIEGGRGIMTDTLIMTHIAITFSFSHRNDFRVIDAATGKEELRLSNIAHEVAGHTALTDGYAIVGDTTDAYRIDVNGNILNIYSIPMGTASLLTWNNMLIFSKVEFIHGALTLGRILLQI